MSNERVKYLLARYESGTISGQQLEELVNLLVHSPEEDQAASQMLAILGADFDEADFRANIHPVAWEQIRQHMRRSRLVSFKKIAAYAAAAIAAGLIATGVYLFTGKTTNKAVATHQTQQIHIAPGTQKATLTLADGAVIELDKSREGELANEGGVMIRSSNGEIAYTNNQRVQTGVTSLKNTLTTPEGGEYKLVLPDGSKVWLNAASSLRYASQFTGKTREVELTGEAYFEIMPNARQPFQVKTPVTTVDVLGTSFNINAYENEPKTKTTLLEGSVRVSFQLPTPNLKLPTILTPGTQALTNASGISTTRKVDTEAAVAWTQGSFSFENATIPEIMRQISRWYHINITYEGVPSSATYVIRFPRNLGLSKALEILDKVNIHTSIKNERELTVLL